MNWPNVLWNVLISAPIFLLAGLLVLRWLRSSGLALQGIPIETSAVPPRKGVLPDRGETVAVFGAAMLFRIGIFVAVGVIAMLVSGNTDVLGLWEKWDGFHYVRLVEQGYGGYLENGQPYFLVFYPLFVWLTRLVRLVVGNTLASGLLVSFLCYSGGCAYLYRLACLEYGKAVAWRAVLFLSVFPFAFFFGGMMTEGLFLLTTAAGLYHIRRHQWLAAGLWGILAALTRMQGLLLVGAAVAELFQEVKPFALRGKALKKGVWDILRRLPVLLLPLLGFVVYLGLNYTVTGNPFAFTGYQMERWSQGFQWVSQVLGYLLKNTFTYGNLAVQLQMWLPELVLFLVFFLLLWRERGKHRSMLTLYAFVCLIQNYCLAWLLSAGRYLACAIPFFLFAACLTEKRLKATVALAVGMGTLFIVALTIYMVGGHIM